MTQPFRFDIGDGANVIFSGENELVVERPLGFVIEYGTRVKVDDLVVFDGHVMAAALQMSHLKR